MSQTYPSTPVLSKIKVGNSTYYLKDADVRTILDGFNNDIVTGTLGLVSDNDGSLVTAANIKAYVDSAVAVGLVIEVVQELPTASADTMGKLYLIQQSGGKTGDYYNEYITVRSGQAGSYTYAWELIGDTRIDLSNYYTKDEADQKFEQIANLGDMAYVDTASTSYTPAGSVSKPDVDVTPTTDTASVRTDDGLVVNGTAATFVEGTFTPNVPTALDLTKFSGGSKASDTFTQGSLPSKAADSFSAGTLPSKANDTFTQGSLPSLGIDPNDSETLIFDAGSLPTFSEGAFTQGTLPSFTEGAFDAGSLPTFSEGAFTPASLAEGFYTAGTAASKAEDIFDGGAPTQVELPTFDTVTVVTGVSAELHEAPAFTGTGVTITVSPDSAQEEQQGE